MNIATVLRAGALAGCLSLGVLPALATDVDGPDCGRTITDFGDAPECIPAYPAGVIGRFPTCISACPAGTRTTACPPISTAPGPTGYVLHVQSGENYWLGCWGMPAAAGIDSEPDGKVNTPNSGISACAPGLTTDCVEFAYGMFFDQDECTADGSDAVLESPVGFATCSSASVFVSVLNCGPPRQIFLNVLVDWNHDGDWNDNLACPSGCSYEWAVKNMTATLPGAGCFPVSSSTFLTGPTSGPSWMRITITNNPVPDDFPWNGSVGTAAQAFQGGETEDYPATVSGPTPTHESTWGRLKTLYR